MRSYKECIKITGEVSFSSQSRNKGGKDSLRLGTRTGNKDLNLFACLLVQLPKALWSLRRVFAQNLGNISESKHNFTT